MGRVRGLATVVTLGILLLGGGGVHAAPGGGLGLRPVAGPGVSLDQAVRRARRSGKVLSADTVDENGRRVHRVRVLTEEGRVRRFRYDAAPGRLAPGRQDSHAPRGRGR